MAAVTRPPVVGRGRAVRPGSPAGVAAYAVGFTILLALLAYGIYSYASAGPAKRVFPTKAASADHLLVGTYAKPAITVSGDAVEVEAPTFTAKAEVTGPLVAGPEGANYEPKDVFGTWTVHIWDVQGTIPLAAADFDSIDHLGTEFKLAPPAGTTMPAKVTTGGNVTFELRGGVPIGEDLVRWAPNGNNIIAKWDNQVEND